MINDAGLAEHSTHEELLARDGVYAEMQRIQTPEGAKITAAGPVAEESPT